MLAPTQLGYTVQSNSFWYPEQGRGHTLSLTTLLSQHSTARQYLTPFFGREALFELKVDLAEIRSLICSRYRAMQIAGDTCLESNVQTNMKATAHGAALQGKLSSVPSCDRTPGEVKITFASKNARQIQLQRGQEATLSYNTQIQNAPVDNARSTQKTQSVSGKFRFLHVLKRERQSTEVIEGQKNRHSSESLHYRAR